MSINNTLGKFIHFGRSNTFNPFSNSKDLKLLNERCFSIPSQTSFANTNAICIPTGLVSNGNSFLSSDFIAEVLETNGTRLTYLIPKLGTIGSNAYPGELDILWFDAEGIQSDYWINNKWAGKVLRLSGKFESSAIIVDEMNKLHTDRINIPSAIKSNPPPINATYTQWNINAPTPTSKWAGTTWQIASTKKVYIKHIIITVTASNVTYWLDNNTSVVECDCIGGGGGGGAHVGTVAENGAKSTINYNGEIVEGRGGAAGGPFGGGGGAGGGHGNFVSFGGGGGRLGASVDLTNGFNGALFGGGGGGAANDGYPSGGNGGGGGGYGFVATTNPPNGKGYGGRGGILYPVRDIHISSVRYLTYTVGAGGKGGNSTSPLGYKGGKGANGTIGIREFTTETIYVRTA